MDILTYNIQSGLFLNCTYNLLAQTTIMHSPHFFGLQEVGMFLGERIKKEEIGILISCPDMNNDLRCNCSQAGVIANATGHTVLFFCTIPYPCASIITTSNIENKKDIEQGFMEVPFHPLSLLSKIDILCTR